MQQHKRWRVVLEAELAPAIGDWVAINGMVPGKEETAWFTFLDGTQAEGFTFLEGSLARGHVPSWLEQEEKHSNGRMPWLHFSDCMEIVGVQHLNWCPENWTGDATLWLLTVKSLPSNGEFEKRLLAESGRQRKKRTIKEKISDWF